jgi:lantibiotic biosynthesis protein
MPLSLQPLLLESSACLARSALDAISSELLTTRGAKVHSGSQRGSLGEGHAGLALAHHYLAASFPKRPHAREAQRSLERAVVSLTDSPVPTSLFGGIPGVAWTIEHVRRHGQHVTSGSSAGSGEMNEGDPLVDVDEALLSALDESTWEGPFDLLSGLGGLALYFLERLPRSTAAVALGRVVHHLDALAVRFSSGEAAGDGVAWRSAFAQGKGVRRGFNLGMGHGTPGLIPILAAIVESKVHAPAAPVLLAGAVRWVLRQRHAEDEAQFAGWIDEHGADAGPFKGARSAWCYGAPGIAVALLAAGTALGEASWNQSALEIAERAAERPVEACEVSDAGLCHGAAGLGHLYHRIHQSSGERFAAEAARRWFDIALGMRDPARGVGGFSSVRRDRRGSLRPQRDASFLTGSAGIALCLASALGGIESQWDRVLGISIPGVGARR